MGLQRVGHDWSDLAHRHPKLIKVKINPSKKENSGKISLVVIGKKIQNNNKTKKFLKSTYFCKPSFKQEIRLTIGHLIWNIVQKERGFPGDSDSKESACNAGDLGSIPWSGRSPGEEHGNPLQCSCLENPSDGGAWWAAVYGVAQGRTRLKRLSSSSSSSGMRQPVAQMIKSLPAKQETWVQSLGQEYSLEKEMATHSSILAWRIPWMEEPGRLQSMGSQSRMQLSRHTM